MSESVNRNNGRIILLLIAGLPVTMILAASWLWVFVERGDIDLIGAIGTANNGELLADPVNISDTQFSTPDGDSLMFADIEPKWTFLVVNNGDRCDSICQETLYLTRQIHIAIGKDFHRIQRVLVTDRAADSTELVGEGSNLASHLEAEHQRLRALTADQETLASMTPSGTMNEPAWYLVDPSGWVMMRYPNDLNYKAVITDLKFLLKNSGG